MGIGTDMSTLAPLRAHSAAPAPPAGHAPSTQPATDPDGSAGGEAGRGAVALVALQVGLGLNLAQRALTETRLAIRLPHVVTREPKLLPLWAFQALTMKSTTKIVPSAGGPANAWGKAYKTSQAMKGVGALLTLGIAVPNTVSGLQQGGPKGLYDTRAGRTGMVSAATAAVQLTFLGKAFQATRGVAGGVAGHLNATLGHEMLGTYKAVGPGVVGYALILANEVGLFDSLNKDERRPLGEIARASKENLVDWTRHPSKFARG